MRLGVLQSLDVWLAEDPQAVEQQLSQRDAVLQLVQVYAHAAQSAADTSLTPPLLDTLRCMLSRSSKLASALASANLVPYLLVMLDPAAPILRVKLLETVRCVTFRSSCRVMRCASVFSLSGMIALTHTVLHADSAHPPTLLQALVRAVPTAQGGAARPSRTSGTGAAVDTGGGHGRSAPGSQQAAGVLSVIVRVSIRCPVSWLVI